MKYSLLTLVLSFVGLTASFAQLEMKFEGEVMGNDVNLVWLLVDETDVESYIIDRSTDGRYWTNVANVPNNGTPLSVYEHLDAALPDGVYTYRMTIVYQNGVRVIPGYIIVHVNRAPTIRPTSGFPDVIQFSEI